MNDRSLIFILMGSSIGTAILAIQIFLFWQRRHFRKIVFHARQVEKRSARFLERRGFEIVGEQVEKYAVMEIDGQKIPYTVRADYLLKKRGKTYIAEVKTGSQVANCLQPHTRRQLLEYYLVYRPQAVLFVDGEEEKIEKVVFPYQNKNLGRWVWTLILFLLGFVIGQWFNSL
ncbi:MAG: hypothetical protein ACUVRN_08920 [Candidatus Caldatribacteriaceae bacterium]